MKETQDMTKIGGSSNPNQFNNVSNTKKTAPENNEKKIQNNQNNVKPAPAAGQAARAQSEVNLSGGAAAAGRAGGLDNPNSAAQDIGKNVFRREILNTLADGIQDTDIEAVQDLFYNFVSETMPDKDANRLLENLMGPNKDMYDTLIRQGLEQISQLPAAEQEDALKGFVNSLTNNVDAILDGTPVQAFDANNQPVQDQHGNPVLLTTGGPGC